MPVLFATLLLAATSRSAAKCGEAVLEFSQDRKNVMIVLAVYVGIIVMILKSRTRKKHHVKAEKRPSAAGALSEALSAAAGCVFLACSYFLLLNEHYRIRLTGQHDVPYLDKLSGLSLEQFTALVGLSLSVVVLLGSAGMTLVTENNKNSTMERLSRKEAYAVVALFMQIVITAWFLIARAWYALFKSETSFQFRQWTGLLWGLFFAGVGQVCVLLYHYLRREMGVFKFGAELIQPERAPKYNDSFSYQVGKHFFQPASFALMGAYLIGSWKFSLMPDSYYVEIPGVDWLHVLLQLLCVDMFTVVNHMAEHALSVLYIASHKPHHRFVSPTMFDAFDGSVTDTTLLILFPLFCTMRTLWFVNAWSYIAFGFVYSVHFMLIHSEWAHPFDSLASKFGIYVARDHHVHHAKFLYNYAHFFTFWDRALGTYREDV